MTTISASSTIGIELTAPSYSNPVVINPDVTISSTGQGIYASTAGWTLQNAGSVVGTIAGVALYEGGNLTNESGGQISGFHAFVGGFHGGVVTLVNAGSIAGYSPVNTSGAAHGIGIALFAGGSIVNQASSGISGYVGIGGYNSALAIVNAGTIAGNATASNARGIVLTAGGSVTNESSASISGYTGIDGSGGTTTVVNAGSISGSALGVVLTDGGVITNQASATIYGTTHGVELSTVAGTLINYGSIASGPVHAAVDLTAGGQITNEAGGLIRGGGGNGVYAINAAATVANSGTIVAGAAGTGVKLLAGGLVINTTTGTISSNGEFGVVIEGSSGSVFNAGRIAAGSAGEGVELLAGGFVSNVSGGTISASNKAGVYITGTVGTVLNAGLITVTQTHSPVDLIEGGYVSNAQTGIISANHQDAIYITNGAGTVVNAGQVLSTLSGGIVLRDGGAVTNQSTGSISGGPDLYGGIYITGAGGNVINAGDVTSSLSAVILRTGGTITNQSTGTMSGGTNGVFTTGGASTAINAGTITGATYAVKLAAGYTNRLVIDPGAVFNGTVTGGNSLGATLVSTLELASGASAGTLSGLGSEYIDFGQITIDSGAVWTLVSNVPAGGYAINDSGALTNAGTLASPVTLGMGASLTNAAGALIDNPSGIAVYAGSAAGDASLLNFGTISNDTAQYAAVEFNDGGFVSNAASGTITGLLRTGVGILAGVGTVLNAGSISTAGAAGAGIVLKAGGYVSNAATGTITTSFLNDIYISGGSATVINAGLIMTTSTAHNAVNLAQAAYVSNATTGTILSNALAAVGDFGGIATVVNSGLIGSNTASTASSSEGVYLGKGGIVNNESTGTIRGGSDGILIQSVAGTVLNAGSISTVGSAGAGILLKAGGYVGNASTGTITTSFLNDIYISGSATVINAGLILTTSTRHAAINLAQTGYIGNARTGTIISNFFGAANAFGGFTTVVNAGLITSTAGGAVSTSEGVYLGKGGVVTNQSTGTIGGGVNGVLVLAGVGTITNAGAIAGGTYAVNLAAGFANRLIVDPGAVFSNKVSGGNLVGSNATSTLELASGSSIGTLTGLDSKYIGFAQITIDSGATWTLAGANTLAAGQTLTVTGATLTDPGDLVNDGGIIIDPSTMNVAEITGTGSVTIDGASTLEVQDSVASGETIGFTGSDGVLVLDTDAVGNFSGVIWGFTPGDQIVVDTVGTATFSQSGSIISVVENTTTLGTLTFDTEAHALLAATTSGALEDNAMCFLRGTLIGTPAGEVPVERLAVGDLVCTLRGKTRPITWIGIGRVLATRGQRSAATPVIVRKGALADNVPHHDLRVTKGHSFYLDEALIPVEFLVNHRSIAWDDRAQEAEIYHIELETHDVLIANGAPAESYRDDGNRWLFLNANSDWDQPLKLPCAPILTGGPTVDAAWLRIIKRSGPRKRLLLTEDPDLHLMVDGKRLDPIERGCDRYVFRLAKRPRKARIVSRSAVPQELGFARDARSLGVAVKQMVLAQPRRQRMLNADAACLTDGYHDFEAESGIRWTDGDAAVPTVLLQEMDRAAMFILHLGGTTQYCDDGPVVGAA